MESEVHCQKAGGLHICSQIYRLHPVHPFSIVDTASKAPVGEA